MAAKKLDSPRVVKYIGTADAREIDKAAWHNVGVADQELTRWDKSNKFTIPLADMKDGALAYLESDSGFVIVDADPQPSEEEEAK